MTIAVVGKTIAISSIVSISGGGSVSGPLAVVSVVGIGMSIAGISVSMVGIAVVSESMSIAVSVVGQAIAIGAIVGIGISLGLGGCVHSGEQAESGNGSGLHVYLFVCKLEE